MSDRWIRATPLAALLIVVFAPALRADGKVFAGLDRSQMKPVRQEEQVAFLSHRDGRERLVIACGFPAGAEDRAVWIFPVRGAVERTKIDVCEKFPFLWGRRPAAIANDELGKLALLVASTQVYPAFCCLQYTLLAAPRDANRLDVKQQVEKAGLHVELVTAPSAAALAAHLKEAKEIDLSGEDAGAFAPYLDGKTPLVVGWVLSRAELQKHAWGLYDTHDIHFKWPCISTEFDSDRPFYPMLATSTYGSKELPLRIYAIGDFILVGDPAKRPPLDVEYFDSMSEEARPERGYTYIHGMFPASAYGDDLWFSHEAPLSVSRSRRFTEFLRDDGRFWVAFVVSVAVLSYLAAGIAGLHLFGRWRGIAVVGLANLGTVVALMIVVACMKGERGDLLRRGAKSREDLITGFVKTFSIWFVVLTILARLVAHGLLT